jgi:hypothetical protein
LQKQDGQLHPRFLFLPDIILRLPDTIAGQSGKRCAPNEPHSLRSWVLRFSQQTHNRMTPPLDNFGSADY